MQRLPTVYPPSDDSQLLLEATLKEIRRDDRVLEVGVGSGYVSENIKDKCSFLIATDINPYAVKMAKERGIDVILTDIAEGIKGRFSLILFNPPYLELKECEKGRDWLRIAIDGGEKGVEISLKFLRKVKDLLDENGRIIIISSSLNFDILKEEIHNLGYEFNIIQSKKLFFEEIYALKLVIDK